MGPSMHVRTRAVWMSIASLAALGLGAWLCSAPSLPAATSAERASTQAKPELASAPAFPQRPALRRLASQRASAPVVGQRADLTPTGAARREVDSPEQLARAEQAYGARLDRNIDELQAQAQSARERGETERAELMARRIEGLSRRRAELEARG